MTRFCFASIISTALLLSAFAMALAEEDKVTIDSISVHLFLENSGTFSQDVLKDNVSAWNGQPITGTIDYDERFGAYLIKVNCSAPREVFAAGEQARIRIIRESDNKILKEQAIADVYVSPSGKITKPVLIHDHICGPLKLEVKDHKRALSASLPWACGE